LGQHSKRKTKTSKALNQLDQASAFAIGKFIEDYNRSWIIERLGHQSPLEVRTQLQKLSLKCA
jgi:hypothetical protein